MSVAHMTHMKSIVIAILMASSGLAVAANDRADISFDGYNRAFLVQSGAGTFYKKAINNGGADGTWVASLDILAAEDAYERTGRASHKALVDELCKTWLKTPERLGTGMAGTMISAGSRLR